MTQKYKNDDIRTAISHNTKLDGYSDKVPGEIADKIQLNVDVTPHMNRFTNFFYSSTISIGQVSDTVNLDSLREFYLTDFYISSSCQTPMGNPTDIIRVTVNGIAKDLLINTISTNLNTDSAYSNLAISLKNPLKLDTGSNIVFNIQADSSSWGVYGYYVDPNVYDTGIDKK
jgi:hypothetical protein